MSSKDSTCAICLEPLFSCAQSSSGEPEKVGVTGPCGHCVHEKCWNGWTASRLGDRTGKCPACKESCSSFVRLHVDFGALVAGELEESRRAADVAKKTIRQMENELLLKNSILQGAQFLLRQEWAKNAVDRAEECHQTSNGTAPARISASPPSLNRSTSARQTSTAAFRFGQSKASAQLGSPSDMSIDGNFEANRGIGGLPSNMNPGRFLGSTNASNAPGWGFPSSSNPRGFGTPTGCARSELVCPDAPVKFGMAPPIRTPTKQAAATPILDSTLLPAPVPFIFGSNTVCGNFPVPPAVGSSAARSGSGDSFQMGVSY
jgi:Ring finger domain